MSNSDRSRPANKSAHLGKAEDIPAALRDGDKTRPDRLKHIAVAKRPVSGIAIGLTILASSGAAFLVVTALRQSPVVSPPSANTAPSNDDRLSQTPAATQSADTDNVLNHLPYSEAPDAELVSIGGGYRLRKAAAAKFQAMVAAARANGVNITTISAFRSVEDQKRLFFGVGAARGQQPTKRAEVSAPPKYSEHHTGYAVDIGDGTVPATNLNQNFDTTPAYKWMKANAATYGFELSFPKNNIQKVSYEPWHWRFVGDINSLETFYKAHNLNSK
ncbi:M15 family metallopeptidase [Chamaesiphon minutus]|uniref:D-alanyl-D-alanine carboxypeptidase n=1 Tax=Chamaesiphon minutus (strain ATCC 27169 / PCC 6605) TaxID=1173020 RepID=K9UIU2_CHAP6|nr:M15 family metallopeptidase [Chamaesiphon minutus]AFY94124.1 D-alanyl-D-alanine carboxypeptidase [Chamaesiphon minutus PCC 6605]